MKTIEIVPAILSLSAEDFSRKVACVPSAPMLQIDLMDGEFVPNKTIGIDEMERLLPKNRAIEYHLMVKNPYQWVDRLPAAKDTTYQIHVESATPDELDEVAKLVRAMGAKLCWAINPDTPASRLFELLACDEVLVMTVVPGRSGQAYLPDMERKVAQFAAKYPEKIIEVDGGLNAQTMMGAIKAGANRIAAASSILAQPDPDAAYKELKRLANHI